uniref:Uncharacterized protein n=1 Tax=Ditylenchus dipsaci TaxID=166011 RepID=A0A915DP77_9BILA
MIEQLSNSLGGIAKKFQNLHPELGSLAKSCLKVVKTTRFSDRLISRSEIVLSKVFYENTVWIPFHWKAKLKSMKIVRGKVASTRRESRQINCCRGGVKLGTSKIWTLVVAEAQGKLTCTKIDGETNTYTDDLSAQGALFNHISVVVYESNYVEFFYTEHLIGDEKEVLRSENSQLGEEWPAKDPD